MSVTAQELPKYKSHKDVWALKIKNITSKSNGEVVITPEENGYASFKVSGEYMRKHNPSIGGYFVVYKDGYESFSPAKAFEEGYSKCRNSLLDTIKDEGYSTLEVCFGVKLKRTGIMKWLEDIKVIKPKVNGFALHIRSLQDTFVLCDTQNMACELKDICINKMH